METASDRDKMGRASKRDITLSSENAKGGPCRKDEKTSRREGGRKVLHGKPGAKSILKHQNYSVTNDG